MITEICKQEKCTGCFACMNICPRDAVVCEINQYGKTVPAIRQDKCIECGMCVKVCPENHPPVKNDPIDCYAAWSRDEQERKYCSSGGAATELSRYFIEQGGIVYGAVFDQNLNLVHMASDKLEQLERLKGSKYVQGYTGTVDREVKEQLKQGKKVLFIGTPCQIAGIRNYLGKEYDNLLLVDLICHGTPPMEYLKEYTHAVTRKPVTDISFRGKRNWRLTLYSGEKVVYSVRNKKDYYFTAFLKSLIYRDNCYKCQYAAPKRCSDITIGDFWGLDRSSLKTPYSGRISVVLINTQIGKKAWEETQDRFYSEPRAVEEAVRGNAQLRKPSVCHPDRELFLQNYTPGNFASAVKTPELRKEIRRGRIKDSLPYRAARKIKNSLGWHR